MMVKKFSLLRLMISPVHPAWIVITIPMLANKALPWRSLGKSQRGLKTYEALKYDTWYGSPKGVDLNDYLRRVIPDRLRRKAWIIIDFDCHQTFASITVEQINVDCNNEERRLGGNAKSPHGVD
jgi:hypothetical protein